jgi:hypothetical protein
MRLFGRIEDRHRVDEPGYEPPSEEPDEAGAPSDVEPAKPLYAISQAGTAATVVGGVLVVIASFLPLDEPRGPLARVASNTIVQQEEWFIPIIGGVIAIAALNSYVSKRRRITLVLLTIACAVGVVALASNKSNRTLYPLNSRGEAETNGPGEVVPFGIAIYLAGAGTAVAFLGSIPMYKSPRIEGVTDPTAVRPDNRPTKTCPDCAETVLAEARVCKHCGYRFT